MAQNRLNLPSMVSRHIGSATEAFFNPLTIMHPPNGAHISQKGTESVDPSVKRIVAMVHKNLNEYKMAKLNERLIAQAEERKDESPSLPPPKAWKTGSMTKTSNVNINTKQHGGTRKSIPQMKAKSYQKSQERMRRFVAPPTETNNFTNQRRLKEVLRQKHILKEILEEHAKIQRDRNSITKEIRAMKEYLNEIRGKLDSSLIKLGSQKTMTETNPKLKKKVNLTNTKSYRANQNRR